MMNELTKDNNRRIDELEALLVENFEPVDCPLNHTFVPGMYIREIFMPKGTVITSLIHNTTHPYVILTGEVLVYSDNDGGQLLRAGDRGITTPGTRRVLEIIEDCIWITYHPTSVIPEGDSEEDILEAVKKVRDQIIEPHENKLLGGIVRNNKIEKALESIY